ncbi:peptide ABC transporter substrate-binding protein [Caldicellulosiruptor acetigenus]|uniref:ABC-type transporter, periplasmic subunit n=1 Tax=Caldicellulosiruptor acetigenus 6A TaxID=632516 RepID=G2PZD6_9FIRM|nr:peptide ABC transporter substrate-binding protein [Caldicellulosiruptor acetigenus]AEM74154.1 ABC-type transporter, periplasmic subunit [Caldicellulosiruptor acetigenus 6A]
MKKRIIAAFILVVFLVTGLFLSSNYRGAEAASSKQVFTYINGAEPRYLDPALNTAADAANIIINVFEGLTRVNVKGETVPGMAEKWTVSKDGLTYTFYIRKNAKWSDGKPVTAYDFEYAWKRALDPKTASEYAYQLYYIKNGQKFNEGKAKASDVGVKALNERTLRVTLEAPTPYFLDLTNFPTYFPVRKDIVEKYGDKWATNPKTYIGNGSFIMTKWVHNSYIEFKKNPNYWDAKSITLEKIVYKLSEDTKANLMAYEAGQVDGADTVPTDEVPRLIREKKLKIWPLLGTYYYDVNCGKKPFDNKKVRQALSLAIDRTRITEILKAGQKPATGFIPYGIKGLSKDFRLEGGSYLPVRADLEKAKKLLAEAGYPNGKGFPEIEIIYNTDENHKKVAEAIQNMWQQLGIKVKLSNMDWKVLLERRHKKDYMVARDGWLGDYKDPMTFLDLFTSYSGNNNTGWSNKKYDELIDKAKRTSDRKQRMQYMLQAEKILMEDYAIIPIYFYVKTNVIRDYVKNYYISPLGFNYFMYAKIVK